MGPSCLNDDKGQGTYIYIHISCTSCSCLKKIKKSLIVVCHFRQVHLTPVNYPFCGSTCQLLSQISYTEGLIAKTPSTSTAVDSATARCERERPTARGTWRGRGRRPSATRVVAGRAAPRCGRRETRGWREKNQHMSP